MNTLISCSSTNNHPTKRLNLWFNYYHALRNELDAKCLMSGSVSEVTNDGLSIPINFCNGDALMDVTLHPDKLNLLMFSKVYTRPHVWTIPAFWRSIHAAIFIAECQGYYKLVYIESDCFILSKRLMERIRSFQSGIAMPWSEMYSIPASQIIVICKDSFSKARLAIEQYTWDEWAIKCDPMMTVEWFVNNNLSAVIWKDIIGDMYGEESAQACPANADFYAQAKEDYTPVYDP